MIHSQPRIYGRVRSVSAKPKIHQRKFKGEETCCNAARVEESGKLETWGKLAEGVGFEPTVALRLRLISSQVPSTTQPPFRSLIMNSLQQNRKAQIDESEPQSDTL
jgi:hypothetical protein